MRNALLLLLLVPVAQFPVIRARLLGDGTLGTVKYLPGMVGQVVISEGDLVIETYQGASADASSPFLRGGSASYRLAKVTSEWGVWRRVCSFKILLNRIWESWDTSAVWLPLCISLSCSSTLSRVSNVSLYPSWVIGHWAHCSRFGWYPIRWEESSA